MFTPRPSSSRPSSSRPQRGGAPASARSHAVLGADPSSPAAPPSRLHFTCPAPPLAAQQLPASAGSPVPHPSFFPPPVAAGSSAALAAPPDSFSAPLFAAQLFSPEASGADGQFTDLPTIRSAAQTAARGRNQGQDVCAEDALRRPSLYARPAQGAGALQSFGAFDCGSDEFRSRRTTRRNVGHRNAGLLVKDEFHAVSLLGQLPREVSNVFKTAEACSELYAKIDVAVGYAMLVTRSNCFVWPYQKKLLALPAVSYTFEAPPSAVDDANADDSLPLADFVSSDGQREPGLLIVSQTGECRYWELVSLAVSGTERCLTMQIHLGTEDQRGTRLLHAEPCGFILSTNSGHLYRISLVNANGQSALSYTALSRPRNMLTRFTSILAGPIVSSSGDTADDNLVVALVAGDSPDGKQSREVFAVTRKLVQKWIVCKSSQEKFLFSKDFSEEVESRIKADLTEEGDLNIKVHDADFTRTCHLAILVSFCSSEEDSRRLCILFGNPTPTEFFVAAAFYPRFDRAADDLRGHEPRLALCGGGPAAFVFLPDSGTLLATVLPLHSPSSTPLFDEAQMFKGGLAGFGTDCWRGGIRARDFVSAGEAVVLVPSHGLVDVEVNVAMVLKEGKKMDAGHIAAKQGDHRQTEYLKGKLEKAVFFGRDDENPLIFSLFQLEGADLDAAALSLSKDILSSESEHISPSMELHRQLEERVECLNYLIWFISANDMVDSLSSAARHTLCRNAEKMVAAVDLWTYQNGILERAARRNIPIRTRDLLLTSVESVLLACGDKVPEDEDDFVKYFLVRHVTMMGELLCDVLRAGDEPPDTGASSMYPKARRRKFTEEELVHVVEVNTILLTCLRAAYDYREEWQDSYAILEPSSLASWTSTAELIAGLEAQYERTQKALAPLLSDLREAGNSRDFQMDLDEDSTAAPGAAAEMLGDQLCDMADILYRAFDERLRSLPSISEEYVPLVRRFELARHRILDALVEAGRISVAFSLSERQQDFKALIKLLMSDPAKERRLEGYMQRFGRPFADTLNEYYVENGDLKALLQQPDSRDQTLADFLDRRDEGAFYPESQEGGWEEEPSKLPRDLAEVAWIHDVKIGRFDKSWKRVRKVAGRETSGSSKVLELCVEKLLLRAAGMAGQAAEEERAEAERSIDSELALLVEEWSRRSLSPAPSEEFESTSNSTYSDSQRSTTVEDGSVRETPSDI